MSETQINLFNLQEVERLLAVIKSYDDVRGMKYHVTNYINEKINCTVKFPPFTCISWQDIRLEYEKNGESLEFVYNVIDVCENFYFDYIENYVSNSTSDNYKNLFHRCTWRILNFYGYQDINIESWQDLKNTVGKHNACSDFVRLEMQKIISIYEDRYNKLEQEYITMINEPYDYLKSIGIETNNLDDILP